MSDTASALCAICLEPHIGNDGWFLLSGNRWMDRLKVLEWREELASRPGMQPVCGVAHVQELVVHWMTTGSLDYPFAHRPPARPALQRDLDADGFKVLGELAVDRETVDRILIESPESLSCLLSALRDALAGTANSTVLLDSRFLEKRAAAFAGV